MRLDHLLSKENRGTETCGTTLLVDISRDEDKAKALLKSQTGIPNKKSRSW